MPCETTDPKTGVGCRKGSVTRNEQESVGDAVSLRFEQDSQNEPENPAESLALAGSVERLLELWHPVQFEPFAARLPVSA
jgi:hypothetical protein